MRSGSALLIFLLSLASAASAQNASLSVDASLSGGGPLVAGTTATYLLTVSNEGPADAANVVLTTGAPAGTTLQSFSAPAGWSCGTSSPITCSIATFAPGSDAFTLVITVPRATPRGTLITLDAAVTTTTNDPNANDNAVELTSPVVWQSLLSLAKSAPASAAAGSPITYVLTVTNAGPSDAGDVTLNDALPAALVIDSVAAPGWTCGGALTCSIPQIGASSSVTITGHTPSSTPPGTLINNADLSASTDPSTHTASASTNLTTSADLSIAKSGPQPVPGTDVTYTITVTNAGPSDAAGVTLTDALPAPLTLQSITAPGWTCVATTCTRAALAPGSSTITLVAHVPPSTPAATTITNTATVSSATFDPTAPNIASASAATPAPASLSATKQAHGPFVETLPFTYTITLANAGPGIQPDNAGDELSDQLPPSLTLLGASASSGTAVADLANNRVRWNGSIPPGGSVSITIQASVNAGAAGSPVSNQASFVFDVAGTGTNGGNGVSNSATFTPVAAGSIPAISPLALMALALLLAALALRS